MVCGTRHCLAINQEGEIFQWGMMHRFNAKTPQEYFGERIEMPGMKKPNKEPAQMDDWERKRAEMLARSHQSYYSAGVVEEKEKEAVDAESAAANPTADRVTHEITNFGQFQAFLQTTPVLLRDLGHVRVRGGAAGYNFTVVFTGASHARLTALHLSLF